MVWRRGSWRSSSVRVVPGNQPGFRRLLLVVLDGNLRAGERVGDGSLLNVGLCGGGGTRSLSRSGTLPYEGVSSVAARDFFDRPAARLVVVCGRGKRAEGSHTEVEVSLTKGKGSTTEGKDSTLSGNVPISGVRGGLAGG